MNNFEEITKNPETLGAFLRGLPVIEAPWDEAFQRKYCAGCGKVSCDVIDMAQFYERTTPQGGSYIVAKAGFLTAAVIMPYVISKKFADELEELSYQCRHFLNTRSAFTTPAAEDEEEPDENQTTAFDAETAEVQE